MKIISYSLWGNHKVYTYGMIENVLLARDMYPGWQVRIHYNDTVPENVVDWLGKTNQRQTHQTYKNIRWTRFQHVLASRRIVHQQHGTYS